MANEAGRAQTEIWSSVWGFRIVVFGSAIGRSPSRISGIERPAKEGDSPVKRDGWTDSIARPRVGLFEIAALIGWLIPSKAKYGDETDSEKVL
jgi:hypothetical protein